jgi:AcrR family transcriptional regulator
MAELVRRAGLPAATIRHYLRLGLAPAPIKLSRNRYLYNERHVSALRLAREMAVRGGIRLAEIRRRLAKLAEPAEGEAFRADMWGNLATLDHSPGPSPLRSRLIASARRLFGTKGYFAVSIDDLCREAGVAKGTFYNHFRSKESIWLAVVEEATEEIATKLTKAGEQGPSEGVLRSVLRPAVPLLTDVLSWGVHTEVEERSSARAVLSHLEQVVSSWAATDPRTARSMLSLALVEEWGELVGGPRHGPLQAHQSAPEGSGRSDGQSPNEPREG